MSIKHIFISHATPDEEIATELAEHLRNAGHETKIDTQDLSLGDNAIALPHSVARKVDVRCFA